LTSNNWLSIASNALAIEGYDRINYTKYTHSLTLWGNRIGMSDAALPRGSNSTNCLIGIGTTGGQGSILLGWDNDPMPIVIRSGNGLWRTAYQNKRDTVSKLNIGQCSTEYITRADLAELLKVSGSNNVIGFREYDDIKSWFEGESLS
jgi:hypothetical protein